MNVDAPFAQNEFRDQNGPEFSCVSDNDRELVGKCDAAMDFADLGVHDAAKRAVFVVNEDGDVAYEWVSDDPGVESDYEEATREAASTP